MPNWLLPSIATLTGGLILAMIVTATLSFAKTSQLVKHDGVVSHQPYGHALDLLVRATAVSGAAMIVLALVNIVVFLPHHS